VLIIDGLEYAGEIAIGLMEIISDGMKQVLGLR
jgi:hypothetical protein